MKFDYSAIADVIETFKQVNLDMQNKINSIDSSLNLIHNSWVSDATDIYIRKVKKELIKFDEIHSEFNSCISFLQRVSDIYEDLEDSQKQKIKNDIENSNIFG